MFFYLVVLKWRQGFDRMVIKIILKGSCQSASPNELGSVEFILAERRRPAVRKFSDYVFAMEK